jgi:hypothetical protein
MTFRLRPSLAVLAAASLVACGGGADTAENVLGQGQALTVESDSGLVKTVVRAEGDHYAQGRNTFLVQLKPATAMLDEATAFMPVHGHATPAPPTISMSGSDYRVANFIFSMPGLWNVTLDVSAAGKTDKVEFSLDVP